MREVLAHLADTADTLGEGTVAAEARDLAERVTSGQVYVACLGQFKRGKSTLINALLGIPLLPVGVVPVTSAITVVRHSQAEFARVHFEGGAVEAITPAGIASYVTEQANPGNAKRVRAVEVGVPASILADGLCLVDTPGIASVFGENTAVTRAFVPRVDAAIVVFGADPPISGDELSLVTDVARETSALLFVLNKSDRGTADERHEAAAFAADVLRRTLRLTVPRIYEVSAARALAGTIDSEWQDFRADLGRLDASRDAVLVQRVGRRARTFRASLLQAIDERQAALNRPLEDNQRHIEHLRAIVLAAEQSLGDLTALLAAEQSRISAAVRAAQDAFLAHAGDLASERLGDALADVPAQHFRAAALDSARSIGRHSIESWGVTMQREAEELFTRGMRRFATLAGEFLKRTAPGAHADIDVDPEFGLDAPPHFYFTELMARTTRSPLEWFELLLPRAARRRRAVRAAAAYLTQLLETNAARFANDLLDRVARSRQTVEAQVRGILRDSVHRAEHAAAAAEAVLRSGKSNVGVELARLTFLADALAALPLDRIRVAHDSN